MIVAIVVGWVLIFVLCVVLCRAARLIELRREHERRRR
jgi:uncharacterized integral membrane protein